MKILGSSINKVSAEKKGNVKGGIKIKSNIDIEDISQEKLNFSDNPGLKISYNFTIEYTPDIASVEIKGTVITMDDQGESKQILKDWKKKKFNHPIKVPLFNFIMDKCNLRSLNLEEELGLPLHISFPKLKPAEATAEK